MGTSFSSIAINEVINGGDREHPLSPGAPSSSSAAPSPPPPPPPPPLPAALASLGRTVPLLRFAVVVAGAGLLHSEYAQAARTALTLFVPLLAAWVLALLPALRAAVAARGGGDDDGASSSAEPLSGIPPSHMWCEPDTTSWVVRGKTYLDDRQKQPSAESLFRLAAVERLFVGDAREQLDLGGRADSWLGQDVAARRAAGEAVPFTFVVNVYVPHASQLSIVCYFRARDEAELRRMEQPEVALFWAFVHGDDAFRNERFKLIPKIPTGSLLIRQAVGQKPALIGRKLTMPYTSRDHYFEVGVDVCSSTVADYTTRLVRDAIATSVVLDLAFTLEGRSAAELPERILGAARFDHIELGVAKRLPPRASL